MRVVFLQPPGRFPTVVQDLGLCWDYISAEGAECFSLNANAQWWKALCSASYVSLLSGRFPLREIISRKLSNSANPEAMIKLADLAGRSLSAMKDGHNYSDASRYAAAVKPFADYTRLLNYLQPEFQVTVHSGPHADGLDYSSSAALASYAASDSLLSVSVDAALAGFPAEVDVCLLYVNSPQDLLTGFIAARLIRLRNPGIYLSILSHSYENFSLDRSAEAMTRNREVFGLVDSIVRFGYQKDDAAIFLIRSLASGVRPAGFIENPPAQVADLIAVTSQPISEVFSPEPVFWTRLSGRRCYWSRCNFCVQNAKHESGKTPSEADIDSALLRISGFLGRGCGYFYFCDEAVPPALLERLCSAIEARKLAFKWACRCRIDAGYSREFFSRLKAAGCYEILFGVESVAPSVQRLMNKYERRMEEGEIRRVVELAKSAGLNIHLTFLVCFPGETLEETAATVRFAASALKDADLATYYINLFTLYPGSDVFINPSKYGIAVTPPAGDLMTPCSYSFLEETKRLEDKKMRGALPGLIAGTEKELGWSQLENRPEYRLCREFYFNYGHGAYIKSAGVDIFKAIRQSST